MLKVTHLSDTHGRHENVEELPAGDILIHSGDATNLGTFKEAEYFFEWFNNRPFNHKIFVPGNHDFLFEESKTNWEDLLDENTYVLINDSIVIEGILFHGVSYQPAFLHWAFNLGEPDLQKEWEKIPDDVDVLITHSPPFGILDKNSFFENCGSKSLFDKISKLKNLKANLFGHIHEDAGDKIINEVLYINASFLENGIKTNPVRNFLLNKKKALIF